MRKNAPIQLIVQGPQTGADRQELARRVSEVHAEFVNSRISGLNCPGRQKRELLQAVIDTVAVLGREPAGLGYPNICKFGTMTTWPYEVEQ